MIQDNENQTIVVNNIKIIHFKGEDPNFELILLWHKHKMLMSS